MGIAEKLEGWLSGAVLEIPAYECIECETSLDTANSTCPECGGEVEETVDEWVPLYWDGLD